MFQQSLVSHAADNDHAPLLALPYAACRVRNVLAVQDCGDGRMIVAGTPLYMSPFLRTEGHNMAGGIWGVGLVMYDVLCGGRLHELFPRGQRD